MTTFPGKRKLSRMSIAEIRAFADGCGDDLDGDFIGLLSGDVRTGVRALARTLENRMHRRAEARKRMETLRALEDSLRGRGKKLICGVDEAGRGPLAGPVVAAAVVLPEDWELPGLDDSKKLSAVKREELYDLIRETALAWGVGMIDNEEIDATNILSAAMKAMRAAVANTGMNADVALVDGNSSPGLSCDERLVIDGDARCASIAAASVMAKVTRDRLMREMDAVYPGYGFSGHKGYGCRSHIRAIGDTGPCDLHRLTFRIVTTASPGGAVVRILEKRLRRAAGTDDLESAASCVSRMKELLSRRDIEFLRDVYREIRG